MHELFPFFLVLIPLLGIIAQWLAWRLQIPSILLLLAFGLCLGFWISPDDVLTDLTGAQENVGPRILFPIVSLSVAVILFEGGLTLRWSQLGSGAEIVFRLICVASIVTWCLTAVMAKYLLGFSWQLAWLLGAILMVTGPTVVGPLLRQIRPNRQVSSVLQWEGILIDPVGAVAAVLVFEVIAHSHFSLMEMTVITLQTLAIGLAIGAVAAVLLVLALRYYLIPDFLHGVFFLVVAITAFWASNLMREESGLITVTILGICLANQHYVSVEHVLEFKEHLRVLLISCLFIVLGSRLQVSDLAEIGWVGIPFVLLLVVLVRPLSVYLSTIGSGWDPKEKMFVGAVAPRGIVAAAVASVFGLKLVALGEASGEEAAAVFEKAELLAPVTFMVILGTVTLCGLGAGPFARKLKLADANPQGVLFAGATGWVREVALALHKFNIRVLLVDTNYANVTAARMEGLDAKCGNILSEHVQEEQDLAGIGKLFAVTPSDEVNILAAMEYLHVFSRANVYQLAPSGKAHGRWQSIPETRRGRKLFDDQTNHSVLNELFESGAIVKATSLTENFGMTEFRELYGDEAIVLFCLDAERKLKIRTSSSKFEPAAGDTVIAMVPAADSGSPPENTEESNPSLI
ncbi:MAG: sodium:proton antiporter [Planctomycetota bacterium]